MNSHARYLALALVLLAVSLAATVEAKEPATTEGVVRDGLQKVERRGLDEVYVRPGASLAGYRRVMLDPVEVSFDKNWDPRSKYRLDTADPQAIRVDLAKNAREVFRAELEKGGYTLVDTPGTDVLRVRASIVDLYINAPETNTPGIVHTYVLESGEMTLLADLFDSNTNTLLVHVRDRDRGRRNPTFEIANRVTNTADARRVLSEWARQLRSALDSAKAGEGKQG